MKKIKIFRIIAITVILFQSSSCKKMLEVDEPIDRTSSELIFSNDKTATAAVLGIYTQMMITFPVISSGGVTIFTALTSDELYNTSIADPNITEFTNNAISPANGISAADFWLKGYNIIYQANACIEGLSNNTFLTASVKNQLLGESKFIRAFIYFYLINIYGDVPLVTRTDYRENMSMPRTNKDLVYEQIINDLKDAKTLLLASYPTQGAVRPNRWTASALLSRVFLYQQKWQLAEAEATAIINSGSYTLHNNLNSVFLSGSSEAIWQIIPATPGFNTTEARYLIPTASASTRPNYPITSYLLNSFEAGDQRKVSWTKSKTVSGQTYFYPYKYKVRNLNEPVTEYYMVFRLTEQFLIRAECYAHLNDLSRSKADIDLIRSRASLPSTSASTQTDLLLAIERERRIEFFAEWGHRWFDLNRTGRSDQILPPIKSGWQATDKLYPIPLTEIRLNPSLTQNPGY